MGWVILVGVPLLLAIWVISVVPLGAWIALAALAFVLVFMCRGPLHDALTEAKQKNRGSGFEAGDHQVGGGAHRTKGVRILRDYPSRVQAGTCRPGTEAGSSSTGSQVDLEIERWLVRRPRSGPTPVTIPSLRRYRDAEDSRILRRHTRSGRTRGWGGA